MYGFKIFSFIHCAKLRITETDKNPWKADIASDSATAVSGAGVLAAQASKTFKRKFIIRTDSCFTKAFTKDGQRAGEWKFYKEQGELLQVINYDALTLVVLL